jgi:hypothetical protein
VDLGKDADEFAKHLDALLAQFAAQFPAAEDKIGDEAVRKINGPEGVKFTFGYLKNVFFIAVGAEVAKQVIELDPARSLATSKKFAGPMQAVLGENVQLAFYLDVAAGLKLAETAMGPPASQPAGEPTESSFHKTVRALGLANVSSVVYGMRVVDRGIYSKMKIFSPAPHQGMLMLFAGKPLTEEDLAGIPDDADYAVAAKVNPSELYQELRRVIAAVDAHADEEFAKGLERVNKQIGVSIEGDILANLGEAHVLSCAPSQGGFITGTAISVELKDAEKFKQVVAKLEAGLIPKPTTQPAEENDMGATYPPMMRRGREVSLNVIKTAWGEIHSLNFKGMPIPVTPAWAVQGDRLYIAAWPQVIQSVVQNKTVKGFRPLTQNAAFLKARGYITGKPSGLAYANTPGILRQSYNFLLLGWTMAANAVPNQAIDLRQEWLPPLATLENYLWPMISAFSAEPDGIVIEGYGSLPGGGLVLLPAANPLMVSIALPALGAAREKAKLAVSMSNLHSLSMMVATYQANQSGQYPPNLEALVESKCLTNPGALKSPFTSHPPPRLEDGKIVGAVDYVYLALPEGAPRDMIMFYERPENTAGRQPIGAAMADGSVRQMNMAEFRAAFKKTQEYIDKHTVGGTKEGSSDL